MRILEFLQRTLAETLNDPQLLTDVSDRVGKYVNQGVLGMSIILGGAEAPRPPVAPGQNFQPQILQVAGGLQPPVAPADENGKEDVTPDEKHEPSIEQTKERTVLEKIIMNPSVRKSEPSPLEQWNRNPDRVQLHNTLLRLIGELKDRQNNGTTKEECEAIRKLHEAAYAATHAELRTISAKELTMQNPWTDLKGKLELWRDMHGGPEGLFAKNRYEFALDNLHAMSIDRPECIPPGSYSVPKYIRAIEQKTLWTIVMDEKLKSKLGNERITVEPGKNGCLESLAEQDGKLFSIKFDANPRHIHLTSLKSQSPHRATAGKHILALQKDGQPVIDVLHTQGLGTLASLQVIGDPAMTVNTAPLTTCEDYRVNGMPAVLGHSIRALPTGEPVDPSSPQSLQLNLFVAERGKKQAIDSKIMIEKVAVEEKGKETQWFLVEREPKKRQAGLLTVQGKVLYANDPKEDVLQVTFDVPTDRNISTTVFNNLAILTGVYMSQDIPLSQKSINVDLSKGTVVITYSLPDEGRSNFWIDTYRNVRMQKEKMLVKPYAKKE